MNAAEIARNNWDANANDCQSRFKVWPVYSAYCESMVNAGRGSELLNEQPPDPQPLRITEPVASKRDGIEGMSKEYLQRMADHHGRELERVARQIDEGAFV